MGTNITNNKRFTFVGTPEIGRLVMTRLQYHSRGAISHQPSADQLGTDACELLVG